MPQKRAEEAAAQPGGLGGGGDAGREGEAASVVVGEGEGVDGNDVFMGGLGGEIMRRGDTQGERREFDQCG